GQKRLAGIGRHYADGGPGEAARGGVIVTDERTAEIEVSVPCLGFESWSVRLLLAWTEEVHDVVAACVQELRGQATVARQQRVSEHMMQSMGCASASENACCQRLVPMRAA